METGELGADRAVHRANCGGTAHLDSDCRNLGNAEDVATTRAGALHSDTPVCTLCSDERDVSNEQREHGRGGHEGPAAELADMGPGDLGSSLEELGF